jgi:hypothetical protein
LGVEPGRLTQDDPRVGAPAEYRAQWLGNLARRKRTRRDLLQQRLKQVVVAAIDDDKVDTPITRQRSGGIETAEPATHDHDAMREGASRSHSSSVGIHPRGRRRQPGPLPS